MSVNKVILVGWAGNTPELHTTTDGTPVCNIVLATPEVWKTKDKTEKKYTEWHRIVFWRKLAEIACQFIKKGSKLYIEGKIRSRKIKVGDQEFRVSEIVAKDLEVLSQLATVKKDSTEET
jgi:single-strand DNA-binding protein